MTQLPDHIWVREPKGLAELALALADAPWVALDSESNSMFVYRERVCLVQLNVGGQLWLVDPIELSGSEGQSAGESAPASVLAARKRALAPLAEALANPALRVWIHGGEYDVACFKRDFDLSLGGIFDTQQAASFLGWQRTGYASVVEAVCGIKLAKDHAQYDWGQRPIHDSALRYALDDVVHLPEVGAQLREQIAAADLEEELELAHQSVCASLAHANQFDPARMWRLKGVREVNVQRHGVLTALFIWRDQKGRELNYPPGRLIANQPLLHLAQKAPTDHAALRRSRVRGAFIREHGDELLEVIVKALDEPPAVPAKPSKPRLAPKHAARSKALKAWRRSEAERRALPAHVVLPPRALEWLATQGGTTLEQCPELGPKRARRYGDQLRSLCGPG